MFLLAAMDSNRNRVGPYLLAISSWSASTFEAYAQTFAAAVLDEARGIAGLTVPVEVQSETDPEATWWDTADIINPAGDVESDALAWRLWTAARDKVPRPTLDAIPAAE